MYKGSRAASAFDTIECSYTLKREVFCSVRKCYARLLIREVLQVLVLVQLTIYVYLQEQVSTFHGVYFYRVHVRWLLRKRLKVRSTMGIMGRSFKYQRLILVNIDCSILNCVQNNLIYFSFMYLLKISWNLEVCCIVLKNWTINNSVHFEYSLYMPLIPCYAARYFLASEKKEDPFQKYPYHRYLYEGSC